MKEQAYDGFALSGCGIMVTFVGPYDALPRQLPCRQWKCDTCREKLIEDYVAKISYVFSEMQCVQVFVGHRPEKGKRLSNFISKQVPRHYCVIRNLDSAVIISNRTFIGAKRCDKKKFLAETLREILSQPWIHGRRISFSKGLIKSKKKVPPHWWGAVVGNVCHQYYNLSTDEAKRKWLKSKLIFYLSRLGKEFLDQDSKLKKSDFNVTTNDTDIFSSEYLDDRFPSSWHQYDDAILERLAIMTIDGRMSDKEAILALELS